jgi:hypothetical protein
MVRKRKPAPASWALILILLGSGAIVAPSAIRTALDHATMTRASGRISSFGLGRGWLTITVVHADAQFGDQERTFRESVINRPWWDPQTGDAIDILIDATGARAPRIYSPTDVFVRGGLALGALLLGAVMLIERLIKARR